MDAHIEYTLICMCVCVFVYIFVDKLIEHFPKARYFEKLPKQHGQMRKKRTYTM